MPCVLGACAAAFEKGGVFLSPEVGLRHTLNSFSYCSAAFAFASRTAIGCDFIAGAAHAPALAAILQEFERDRESGAYRPVRDVMTAALVNRCDVKLTGQAQDALHATRVVGLEDFELGQFGQTSVVYRRLARDDGTSSPRTDALADFLALSRDNAEQQRQTIVKLRRSVRKYKAAASEPSAKAPARKAAKAEAAPAAQPKAPGKAKPAATGGAVGKDERQATSAGLFGRIKRGLRK